MVAEKTAGRKM